MRPAIRAGLDFKVSFWPLSTSFGTASNDP